MKKLIIILITIGLAACKKDKPIEPVALGTYEKGILVLNEGLFEQNNSSLTFYDYNASFQQVFKVENDRGLGDTANDFKGVAFGNKNYIIIAVDVSSQIEIIDRFTLKSVKQIPQFEGINAREPRRVVFAANKAFICNFDGTVAVVSMATLNQEALIEVGANPDGMVVVDDRLYVSNSGGLNYPVYDSTVTVIDIHNNLVLETFETRINSSQMVVDQEDDIYLTSTGNYDDVAPAFLRINTELNEVEAVMDKKVSSMQMVGDWLYFYNGESKAIERYHTITETFENNPIIDVSGYETFYGMEINPVNQEIVCLDANGYVVSSSVRVYDFGGNFLYEFNGGLNATGVLFNN